MQETPTNTNTVADEDRYQLKTYAKWPISLERGEGCYVYDSDGKRYLDLYGGHAVVATGHCHPKIVRAIQEQAAQFIFYSNVVYNGVRARAVRKLVEAAGPPYYQAFLANSGSEANENAIKLARALTGRTEVISLEGSFHGRTYGSLSATGIAKYSAYLNTPVPAHRIVPARDAAGAVSDKTAALLVEPIQSLGGITVIPGELLAGMRQACSNHDALLIFDEVQVGIGRTGQFLYSGINDVYPDLVTLAKGIASGFPASALLLTEAVARQVKSGDLGTTFGGGPLACACIEATLDVIQEEDILGNVRRVSSHAHNELSRLPIVEEVRGAGLLLGLRFAGPWASAKSVQRELQAKGILTGTSDDPSILRLMPPLIITEAQIDSFITTLASL
ncbi:MAG: aspartate aminotransferase family protein [Acidobacteria bacterium]|nr:MAG: aspartate aminotransferase family protein [Acidobacteriota bacterium]